MCQEVFQHLQVDLGVADDSLLPHLLRPGLELRLDETGNLTALAQQAVQRRKDKLQ